MGELCAWCKNREALPYERYEGCCGLHCRDLMECDKDLAKRDKKTEVLEGIIENVRKYLNHKEETPRHIIDIYIENALKKLEEVQDGSK